MTTRWMCEECRAVCDDADVLRAPDPFTTDGLLTACPQCRAAEKLVWACDVPGCKERADSGTPTPNGYRRTCHYHIPEGAPKVRR